MSLRHELRDGARHPDEGGRCLDRRKPPHESDCWSAGRNVVERAQGSVPGSYERLEIEPESDHFRFAAPEAHAVQIREEFRTDRDEPRRNYAAQPFQRSEKGGCGRSEIALKNMA